MMPLAGRLTHLSLPGKTTPVRAPMAIFWTHPPRDPRGSPRITRQLRHLSQIWRAPLLRQASARDAAPRLPPWSTHLDPLWRGRPPHPQPPRAPSHRRASTAQTIRPILSPRQMIPLLRPRDLLRLALVRPNLLLLLVRSHVQLEASFDRVNITMALFAGCCLAHLVSLKIWSQL
jgi:hypothetical protein